MSPSASPSHGDASGRTPTTASWFRVYWLTSQARYVRVCLSRRAMHASCDSPWHFSAKRHVLGACFSLMAPFRTRFSRYKMAYSANVQRLIGCLYTLRDYSILTCRFHGTGHLSAKRRVLDTCFLLTSPFRSMLLTWRGGPPCLTPRAHGVPVYSKVLRHSYSALSRRTVNQR